MERKVRLACCISASVIGQPQPVPWWGPTIIFRAQPCHVRHLFFFFKSSCPRILMLSCAKCLPSPVAVVAFIPQACAVTSTDPAISGRLEPVDKRATITQG
jgi:hypothetical protein